MKFFSRKPKKREVGETFLDRIHEFWAWWTDNSDRILESVDSGGGASIQPEVSAAIRTLFHGFCPWTFGPSENPGHSFIFAHEGDQVLRLLTPLVIAEAPVLDGWTWHSSKPPSPLFDKSNRIGLLNGNDLGAQEIWVTATPDDETETFHLVFWSPRFAELAEGEVEKIVSLFLDSAFGEEASRALFETFQIGEDQLADSISFLELPEHVRGIAAERNWTLGAEQMFAYSFEEPLGDFPRGDIHGGMTELPDMAGGWFEAGGPVNHPMPGAGVHFAFLQFPLDVDVVDLTETTIEFKFDRAWARRQEIVDAVKSSLGGHGRVTGQAWGSEFDYIDLLLIDGERSLQLVENALASVGIEDWESFPFTNR